MKKQSILLPIFTALACAAYSAGGGAAESSSWSGAPQLRSNSEYKMPPPSNPWAERQNNGENTGRQQNNSVPWGGFPAPFWQPGPFFGASPEDAGRNAQPRDDAYPGRQNMQRRGGGGMGGNRSAPPWGERPPKHGMGGGSNKHPQAPSGSGMNMPFGAFPPPGMGFPGQMPGRQLGQAPAQSDNQAYDAAPRGGEGDRRDFPGGFPGMGMPGFSGMPMPSGGGWPRRNNFSTPGMERPSYERDTSRMPRPEQRNAGMGGYPPRGMNYPTYSERGGYGIPEPSPMEYGDEPRMGYPGFMPEPPPFAAERDMSGGGFSSNPYGGLPGFPQTPAGDGYSESGTGFGGSDNMASPYGGAGSSYPGGTTMPDYSSGYPGMPPAYYGTMGGNYPTPQEPSYKSAPGTDGPFSSGAGGGRPAHFPPSASERMSSAAPPAGFSSTPPAGMGFPGYTASSRPYPGPEMTVPPDAALPSMPAASAETPPAPPLSQFDAPAPEYPPLPAAGSGKTAGGPEDAQEKSAPK